MTCGYIGGSFARGLSLWRLTLGSCWSLCRAGGGRGKNDEIVAGCTSTERCVEGFFWGGVGGGCTSSGVGGRSVQSIVAAKAGL
jgi:hypothetical protein